MKKNEAVADLFERRVNAICADAGTAEAEAEAALVGNPAHEELGCVAAGAALLETYCHLKNPTLINNPKYNPLCRLNLSPKFSNAPQVTCQTA